MTDFVKTILAQSDVVAEECSKVLEAHLADLKGLKGIGLRTGLSLLKAGRPNAGREAVSKLLPQITEAVAPEYQRYCAERASYADFDAYARQHADRIGEAVMGTVDARVGGSGNAALRSTYPKLRDALARELVAAMPALASVFGRYAPK